MAQSLSEQVVIIERALGERMIESALVILHTWMVELGEKNRYEESHAAIRKQYQKLFSLWLTSDDEEIDEQLNTLTGDAFQLFDAIYADIRIARGLSPDMHGFNPDSTQSVMNYFYNCVQLRNEDFEWLQQMMNDTEHADVTLVAVSSLAHNLRECFSLDGLLALINGIKSEIDLVANQCLSSVLMLLIQYDIRIDFFVQLQEAFLGAIKEIEEGQERVVNILCVLIEASNKESRAASMKEMPSMEQLPDEQKKIIHEAGLEKSSNAIIHWFPASESEYLTNLIQILQDTWLFNTLIEDDPAAEFVLVETCLKSGYREWLWLHTAMAEKIFRAKLRKGSKTALDYINYAHCLLLKGDRMMAFENYRQARNLCKNVKEFYGIFRPDRSVLVEKGVPVEQVYLIEDQLFQG